MTGITQRGVTWTVHFWQGNCQPVFQAPALSILPSIKPLIIINFTNLYGCNNIIFQIIKYSRSEFIGQQYECPSAPGCDQSAEWGWMSDLAAAALITAFVSLIPESGPHSAIQYQDNVECLSETRWSLCSSTIRMTKILFSANLFSASQNFVEKKSSSTVGNAAASTCAWVSLKKKNSLAFGLQDLPTTNASRGPRRAGYLQPGL